MTRKNGIPLPSATNLGDAPLYSFGHRENFRDVLTKLNAFLVGRGQRVGNAQGFQYGKGTRKP